MLFILFLYVFLNSFAPNPKHFPLFLLILSPFLALEKDLKINDTDKMKLRFKYGV